MHTSTEPLSTSLSPLPPSSRAPAGHPPAASDRRAAAVNVGIPLVTTVQGVTAAVQGIEALRAGELSVRALQELDYTED